jgi:hypothetical protein
MRRACIGNIKSYDKENKMGVNRLTAVNKMAAEVAYLALQSRFVCMYPSEVPPIKF